MTGITDRRKGGVRARLARLLFSAGRVLVGRYTSRNYEYYAQLIPTIDVVEVEVNKVLQSGEVSPEASRDVMLRLATQLGRIRREGIIVRLALHDAGLLIIPPEELERIRVAFGLRGKI